MTEKTAFIEQISERHRARLTYIDGTDRNLGAPGPIEWKTLDDPNPDIVLELIMDDGKHAIGWVDFFACSVVRLRNPDVYSDHPTESETLYGRDHFQPEKTLVAVEAGKLVLASEISKEDIRLPGYLQQWLIRFRFNDKKPPPPMEQKRSNPIARLMQYLPENIVEDRLITID